MENSKILRNVQLLITISVSIISCSISSSSAATISRVPLKTSTDFIKTSCTKTTYPQLCYTSLSSYASTIQTSPKALATTALHVALAKAHNTSSFMVKLSRARGLKPRESGAMKDCVEELSDAVYELKRSIAEFDSPPRSKSFELVMSDVQTWVSAALTDEDTCSDGFAGKAMDGKVKTVVRKHIEGVSQLTSNALALVNSYASLHS